MKNRSIMMATEVRQAKFSLWRRGNSPARWKPLILLL